MKEYKDLFGYNDIKVDGKIRLGASSIPQFYNNPSVWYRRNVSKEDRFLGNDNTVIGTIIHSRIEAYWLDIEIDTDIEVEYIDNQQKIDGVNLDEWKIRQEVDKMWEVIVMELPKYPKPTDVEGVSVFEIPKSKYFIGGSYDYIDTNRSLIGDIKTTSQTPKQIKVGHKFQIYTYELCRRLNGLEPMTNIEVMYIVKLKKEPKVVIFNEEIDSDYMEWIKQEIKNLVKRCELVDNDSSLKDILFFYNQDSYYN